MPKESTHVVRGATVVCRGFLLGCWQRWRLRRRPVLTGACGAAAGHHLFVFNGSRGGDGGHRQVACGDAVRTAGDNAADSGCGEDADGGGGGGCGSCIDWVDCGIVEVGGGDRRRSSRVRTCRA